MKKRWLPWFHDGWSSTQWWNIRVRKSYTKCWTVTTLQQPSRWSPRHASKCSVVMNSLHETIPFLHRFGASAYLLRGAWRKVPVTKYPIFLPEFFLAICGGISTEYHAMPTIAPYTITSNCLHSVPVVAEHKSMNWERDRRVVQRTHRIPSRVPRAPKIYFLFRPIRFQTQDLFMPNLMPLEVVSMSLSCILCSIRYRPML